MELARKAIDHVEFKTEPEGSFTALISTFGKVDKRGDLTKRGTFAKSIQRWQQSRDPLPLVFAHQTHDPSMYIGDVKATDMHETERGLEVTGHFNFSTENGRKVFEQVRARTIKEWSYTYEFDPKAGIKMLADGVRQLLAVHIREIGPCLIGVGDTETLATKCETAPPSLDAHRQALARVALAPYRQQLDLLERRLALDRAAQ